MRQALQDLTRGKTEVIDVPCPAVARGELLIRTTRSLISPGTERILVDFSRANLIDKARQQPGKVKQVLEKIGTDGLMPTLDAVRNKLDQPMPLGYCNTGYVVELGQGVTGYNIGDRIASNGRHAEVVSVPVNLCATVPAAVSDDEASFTVLSAIALQGMRLIQPTLGEAIAVTGLGLIGLITVQLLRAHGCRVLGLDFNHERLALAREFGAEVVDLSAGGDPVRTAQAFTRGNGIDAVIITASTKSSVPVHEAALMCRKRGRIVLVGVTGLELSRADFYEKELTFQVSCSYGPGRYDVNYEKKGLDYPIGFVRWTEQRNFEAVLDMTAEGRLDVKPLISHRFALADAEKAYELISGTEPSLGVLLEYPTPADRPLAELRRRTVDLGPGRPPASLAGGSGGNRGFAFIGAGSYASSILIPAFKAAGAHLATVASSGGVSSMSAGRKFGFGATSTDIDSVLADGYIGAVVIGTRHDSHAKLVCRALAAGKDVFVEKPLAMTLGELEDIRRAYDQARNANLSPLVMVGFNRRFAPQVQKIKALLGAVTGPKAFVMTVNAGAIAGDHWTQDPEVGGGRIIGEACHFVDLLRFLAGVPITAHRADIMDAVMKDTVSLQLRFADGSIGTIHYFANGSKSFPKERLEVFAGGRVLQLDNFRKLAGFGWPGFRKMNLWRQDKGQKACAADFVRAVKQGGPSPIPFDELMEVSRAAIELGRS